jgi:thiol-disulfide isomerase/thioredoxin
LATSAMADEKYDYSTLLASNEADFATKAEAKKAAAFVVLDKGSFSADFVAAVKRNIDEEMIGLKQYYDQTQAVNKMNSQPSPSFDFVNYKGGKSKLEDFRGKYVYIDVWATWCGPCRAEIPFLKEIEAKYHDKNIAFVSISVDVKNDTEKWRNLVKDKQLGGVQLIADNDWKSKFVTDYGITGIPRFILIDPKGNIVKADAPRPSSSQLKTELNELLK